MLIDFKCVLIRTWAGTDSRFSEILAPFAKLKVKLGSRYTKVLIKKSETGGLLELQEITVKLHALG